MFNLKKLLTTRTSIIALIFFLVIWEISVKIFKILPFILPPPSKILLATWSFRKVLFLTHLPVTVLEILLGLLLSIILSVLLALLMLKSSVVEKSLYPFLVASQTIPIIVLSPVIIMWFGYGLLGKVVITVLITFFPIIVNTFEGIKNVDSQYINLLKTMGASSSQIFWKVRVPAALPAFFTGLKVGASVSVIGAVIGEWLGGNAGLGVFSRRMSSNMQADAVFAAVLILALLGISLFGMVKKLEAICIPWYFKINNDRSGRP
jgi:putative hydroxymethylpyrimidine transport system permease protein